MMSDLRTDRGSRPVPSQPEARMSSPKKTIAAVVALGAVAAFGVGIWFAYDQGVKRGASGAPPLVRAEQGPAKIAPENPGGMQVPNQDKQIYERIAGGNGQTASGPQTERLLPPPERPSATPTSPSVTVPMRPAPNAVPNQAPAGPTASTIPNRTDAPSATPIPAAPAQSGQPQTLAPPPATTAAAPRPVAAPPAAAPAAPAPAPAAPTVTATPGGSARVQLASLKDRAAAQSTWTQLQKKYGELLGDLTPTYENIEIPGKGSFVRLQAGPLKDRAAAQSLCQQLSEKKQGCIVVGR